MCSWLGRPLFIFVSHFDLKESDVTFQAAIYPGSQVLLGVLIGLILIF